MIAFKFNRTDEWSPYEKAKTNPRSVAIDVAEARGSGSYNVWILTKTGQERFKVWVLPNQSHAERVLYGEGNK